MGSLPEPLPGAIIYQDEKVYSCLANNPLSRGHCVVVWKDEVEDIHSLSREDYLHLMWVVEQTRDAQLKALKLEKVYMMYLDETKHVHWHLVPRYEQKGLAVLNHQSGKLEDVSLAKDIKNYWQ